MRCLTLEEAYSFKLKISTSHLLPLEILHVSLLIVVSNEILILILLYQQQSGLFSHLQIDVDYFSTFPAVHRVACFHIRQYGLKPISCIRI
jgi:hypothetical protein